MEEEWQPIETAPKDGTEILAFHKDGKTWHQVKWMPMNNGFMGYWGMIWHTGYRQYHCDFSHWVPLPASPPQ